MMCLEMYDIPLYLSCFGFAWVIRRILLGNVLHESKHITRLKTFYSGHRKSRFIFLEGKRLRCATGL